MVEASGHHPDWGVGLEATNKKGPAVSYSPTPSRVQYHRRCGS